MEAARDRDWLAGESHWYPKKEDIPVALKGEVEPLFEWACADLRSGGRGWIRQRLKPLGPTLLFPLSWAPLFLVLSVLPLAFPDNTPDDQTAASILFLISWLLIIVPFISLRDGLSNPSGSPIPDVYPFDLLSILIGAVVFVLHILIDPRIGWISFTFFVIAQYRTLRNISECVGQNSARWLLPIRAEDYSDEIISNGWKAVSNNFRNGPLAHWQGELPDYSAEIRGVSRGEDKFAAFVLKHRGGLLHDPFCENIVQRPDFSELLATSPLKISGEMWPQRFLVDEEQ